MEVKAVLHSLVFASESNGGSSKPCLEFLISSSSLVACIFLKNNNEKTKTTFSFFSSLFSCKCTVAHLFPLFPAEERDSRVDFVSRYVPAPPPLSGPSGGLSYSSSSVGRSSSRSRSSLGNGRLCVTPARRETGRLSSSTSVGSSFTCTGWLRGQRAQALVYFTVNKQIHTLGCIYEVLFWQFSYQDMLKLQAK